MDEINIDAYRNEEHQKLLALVVLVLQFRLLTW